MTVTIQPQQSTDAAYVRAGVLVGTLLGRYLEDPELLVALASHVVDKWQAVREDGDLRNLDRWWDGYVGHVESSIGGVDCATSEQLTRLWTAYARHVATNV
jgi:hypothetical protein